ncbi:hypothetical protein ABBQ38_006116 [Trebouxia sp. C0009 RCD-2024]
MAESAWNSGISLDIRVASAAGLNQALSSTCHFEADLVAQELRKGELAKGCVN